jgi:hypothetical protein
MMHSVVELDQMNVYFIDGKQLFKITSDRRKVWMCVKTCKSLVVP